MTLRTDHLPDAIAAVVQRQYAESQGAPLYNEAERLETLGADGLRLARLACNLIDQMPEALREAVGAADHAYRQELDSRRIVSRGFAEAAYVLLDRLRDCDAGDDERAEEALGNARWAVSLSLQLSDRVADLLAVEASVGFHRMRALERRR